MIQSLIGFVKGLVISSGTDTTKKLIITVDSSATTGTTTTLVSAQTANRTVTLPDFDLNLNNVITASSTTTFTNKTIDADAAGNSIVNIENADIKAAAAIDATKIANGSVSNAEFQFLDGVTSNIQTQLNSAAVNPMTTSGDIVFGGASGAPTRLAGDTSNTRKFLRELSVAGVAQPPAWDTIQASDINGVVAVANGGTGQTTAPNAINGLLPTQTGNNGKFLSTNGSVSSWVTGTGGAPTGDPNTLAYFDAAGNLDDNTCYQVFPDPGVNGQPYGILLGTLSGGADYVIDSATGTLGGVAVATVTAPGNGAAALTVYDNSMAVAKIAGGAKVHCANTSLVVGTVDNSAVGGISNIEATNGSIANGLVTTYLGYIQANTTSHAQGYINTANDGRIISSGSSIATGNITLDFSFINISQSSIAAIESTLGVSSGNYAQNGSLICGNNEEGGLTAYNASISVGSDLAQTGHYAQTFGVGHVVDSDLQHTIGRFSETVSSVGWVADGPLFVAGNGTNSGSRSTAYRLDKDGKITTTGAQKNKAVRIVAAAAAISERTDYKIIYNTAGASGNLTLPVGEDGLEFIFSPKGSGGAVYTLTPSGGNTLDANITAALAASPSSTRIAFFSGAWYLN